MNAKKFSAALGEVDDKYITNAINYKANRKKNSWIKWVAAAVCLALIVTVGIPLVSDPYKTPDEHSMIDSVLMIKYENAYYEVIEDYPNALERRGIITEITPEVAGERIVYLKKENENARSDYIISETETDIELFEYILAPHKAVRILRDGNKYFAAVFRNYLVENGENLPFMNVFEVYGINSADDISTITPVKNDNSFEKNGNTIEDPSIISMFYSEITALQAYGRDAIDRIVFPDKDESEADKLHGQFANDRKDIMIETKDGLKFIVNYYPSYGFIYGSETLSYYEISPSMAEWLDNNLDG